MSVTNAYMPKRKKNYSSFSSGSGSNQKRRKQLSLEPGMSGFLCTANFREKDCVRDAYKILNEFADELYGQESAKDKEKEKVNDVEKKEEEKEEEEEEDISTALSKEISELKAQYAKPVNARRFQVVDTGVKNVVFIRSTLPQPLEIVMKIVTELDKTKEPRTRYLLRLIPVEVICKAYMNNIVTAADALFDKYFVEAPKTFCIVFNRHSNNSIHKSDVIEELARMVMAKNPGNKADLKKPEIAVVVEVIRGVCLLSIAPHYYLYRKYNLMQICNVKEEEKKAAGEIKDGEDTKELTEETQETEGAEETEETKETERAEETEETKETEGAEETEETKETEGAEETGGTKEPAEIGEAKETKEDKEDEQVKEKKGIKKVKEAEDVEEEGFVIVNQM